MGAKNDGISPGVVDMPRHSRALHNDFSTSTRRTPHEDNGKRAHKRYKNEDKSRCREGEARKYKTVVGKKTYRLSRNDAAPHGNSLQAIVTRELFSNMKCLYNNYH